MNWFTDIILILGLVALMIGTFMVLNNAGLPLIGIPAALFVGAVYLHFLGATINRGPLTFVPWWVVEETFFVTVIMISVHVLTNRFNVIAGFFGALMVLLAIIVLLDTGSFGTSHSHTAKGHKAPQGTAAAPRPNHCLQNHRIAMDPNLQHRFLSHGVQANTTAGFRKEIPAWVAHDPVGLYAYYKASPLQQLAPIDSVTVLVAGGKATNGNCFSNVGVRSFNQWLVLWKTAQVQQVAQMPPGWGNSGVVNGQPVSSAPPTGNTSGWMVTFKGANGQMTGQMGVMKRCANPVTPHPVLPPQGSPPPPPTTVPPTTPPGHPKNCRGKDPDPTTDTKKCDPTGGTNKNPSSNIFPPLPPSSNHPVTVVSQQETPTTVVSGRRNTPYSSNTPNGDTGDGGMSDNPSDPPPTAPAQGVTSPDPHPIPGIPPVSTPPPAQCSPPLYTGCGTG